MFGELFFLAGEVIDGVLQGLLGLGGFGIVAELIEFPGGIGEAAFLHVFGDVLGFVVTRESFGEGL